VLIFLLIQGYVSKIDRIVIDPEYPGHEELIRSLIGELLKSIHAEFENEQITFKRVGKRAKVHKVANSVFRKEAKPTFTVTAKDLFKIIAK